MATENYFDMPLGFKLRKVFRYVRLYGVRRTYEKVQSQMHMRASEGFEGEVWDNPSSKSPGDGKQSIGIIGCGTFAFSTIAGFLDRAERGCIKAVMDIDTARARHMASRYGAKYATTNANNVISDPDIDLVYIASNHATHATYACDAIKAGKHVHIEKPHVVSWEQLTMLRETVDKHPDPKIFMGFNRPKSKLFLKLKDEISNQPGSLMINWFIAGHEIDDDHWYFNAEEGGRILGNLCHWTDLTLELVGSKNAYPIKITPTSPPDSKSDFVTAITFGDGSLAAITFSAKGHTFEGVREILNLHRGDVLAEIRDFQTLRIERVAHKKMTKLRHRNHGHEENVMHTFHNTRPGSDSQADAKDHVFATAELFLAIKDAHVDGQERVLEKPGMGGS